MPVSETAVDLIPASSFSYEELVEAYNRTRVDYMVPMPMNAARLREYVDICDIDLETSAVAVDGSEILGLAMLGLRTDQAWISRLGVIRSNRRQRTGWILVTHMIDQARQKGAKSIVLEVIKNNVPAHNLFMKKGFRETRELLVLRRPPNPHPETHIIEAKVESLGYKDALRLLERRQAQPSWLDANESLINAGQLSALHTEMSDGSRGWLVFQNTVFQLSRLVIQTEQGDALAVGRSLLHYLHSAHPVQDTKTENLPAEDPHWPAFKELGYLVTFRRIEMILPLTGAP